MEVKVSDIRSCEKSLEIKVPYSETLDEEKSVLEYYRKEAKVEGFRKGKAPVFLIKKIYGKRIEDLLLDRLINKHYGEAIKKEKVHPINEANITSVKYDKDEGLVFVAVIEVKPVFELAELDGIRVNKEIRNISETEIDVEIERLRYQLGVKENVKDGAEKGHFLLVDIQEVDPKTNLPLIGKSFNDRYFRIGDNVFGDNTDEQLFGLKTGDKKIITREIPKGITEQSEQNKMESFSISVKNIENIILPNLDDEFAKDVNEKFKNMEDLKNHVKNSLKVRAELESNQNVRKLVEIEIVRRHDFDVPNSMMEGILNQMIQNSKKEGIQNVDEEFLRTSYHGEAVKIIKWFWIKERLLKENKVIVEDSEIEERINKYTKIVGIDSEKARAAFRTKQAREKIKEEMVTDKLFNIILKKVKIENINV